MTGLLPCRLDPVLHHPGSLGSDNGTQQVEGEKRTTTQPENRDNRQWSVVELPPALLLAYNPGPFRNPFRLQSTHIKFPKEYRTHQRQIRKHEKSTNEASQRER